MKSQSTLFTFVVLLSVLLSCNTTKAIKKKDNQALNRVKANVELLNDAGSVWRQLNPCYPDTIKIGKEIIVVDSSYGKEAIQELNNTISYLFSLIGQGVDVDSLTKVIKAEVEAKCKPKKIEIFRTDTLPPDRREEQLLRAELVGKGMEISNLQGQNKQQQDQIAELKKDAKKKNTFIIIGSIVAILIILGLVYLLFKRK